MNDASATLNIICFAGNDWWVHNPLTEKQWMRRLADRGHRVLFVNSIGIGIPGKGSAGVPKRFVNKLLSIARWLRKSEQVWVLTPVLLPLWSIPAVRFVNRVLLHAQIRPLLFLLGMSKPLFWSGIPTASALLNSIPHRGVIYYIQDRFLAYYDPMKFTRLPEDHRLMLRAADAVICASIGIAEETSREQGNVFYIPHGVSDEFFTAEVVPANIPEKLRSIPKPIVGYWGSLESLTDLGLIRYLAERHPEWSLVFIGTPMFDVKPFRSYSNVFFPGPLSHEDIPAYGIHFDVALLSFVQSEWVSYCCPVKYREYLALGLPVVSVPIIEVERAFPGAAYIASSHEEFCAAIERALAENSPEAARKRRRLVIEQTWNRMTDQVDAVMTSLRD